MTRFARFLLLLLAFLTMGLGASPHAMLARPALWAVRDADTTIYLFGTVHFLRPEQVWFSGKIANAFARSDRLVLEVPPPDRLATRRIVAELGEYSGPELRDHLSKQQLAIYEGAMAKLGMPPDALDNDRPWLASQALGVKPLEQAGYRLSAAPETILADAAKHQGKPVSGLETMRFQLGLFAALPPAQQKYMLIRAAQGLPDAVTNMDATVQAWGRGDVIGVGAALNRELGALPPGFSSAILTDRNRRWVGWIRHRMTQPGTVFVAVGAGHLAGPQSVVAQLRAAGLTVQRLQ